MREFLGNTEATLHQEYFHTDGKVVAFWTANTDESTEYFRFYGSEEEEATFHRKVRAMYPEGEYKGSGVSQWALSMNFSRYLVRDLVALIDDEKRFKSARRAGYDGVMILRDYGCLYVWRLVEDQVVLSDEVLLESLEDSVRASVEPRYYKGGHWKEIARIYRKPRDFVVVK